MPGALSGKVILLTGGEVKTIIATAHALMASGARIVITYSDPTTLDETSLRLGPEAVIVHNYASGRADGMKLAQVLKKNRVMLDQICLNMSVDGFSSLGSRMEQGWEDVFKQSIRSPYLFLSSLIPVLNPRSTIRIRMPGSSDSSLASSASRAAAILLSHALSKELLAKDFRITLDDDPCA